MREFIVTTDQGEYAVRAKTQDQAKDAVYKLTLGRVNKATMTVRCA